jgi:hypothetical protein
LDRAAVALDNPDYVEAVLHSYRHRLGLAPSYPRGLTYLQLPVPDQT